MRWSPGVISFLRVDNRLIHGQVVEAWLPYLKVARVVVADDEAAESPLVRAAMGLAVDGSVEVQIARLRDVDFPALSDDAPKTLLLVRDVQAILDAQERGLKVGHVNLGNVHYATGRKQVSPSVFLNQDEVKALEGLAQTGAEIEIRGVPTEKPLSLGEIEERFSNSS
jgi:PTS system mannose-specific IIB component